MHELPGRTVTQLGGLALICSLFFNWYAMDFGPLGAAVSSSPGVDTALTGWKVFGSSDYALVAVGAIALVQPRPLGRSLLAYEMLIGGSLATGFVAFRLLAPPPIELTAVVFQLDPQFGVFVALAAASAITFGGWRQVLYEARRGATDAVKSVVPPSMDSPSAAQARPSHAPNESYATPGVSPPDPFSGPSALPPEPRFPSGGPLTP